MPLEPAVVFLFAVRRMCTEERDDGFGCAPANCGVMKRFNSAGVVIRVSAGTVTGRVYLKDGGYDDVYEKDIQGNWRFKRVYLQK